MSDAIHLAILEKGVNTWNQWREEQPHIAPNLAQADLTLVDCCGANLTEANLLGANCLLTGFVGADLSRADLRNANFRSVDLTGASMTGARLLGTLFADSTIQDVVGLDQCIHEGPSSIDFLTLANSWPLPLPFLRGCGLPDTYIESLDRQLGQPNQFYSVFISYSTKDQAFADRLHADLQNKGVRCWFAPHDALPGQKLHVQIPDAIDHFEKLLVILSDHSMNSEWVKTEIAHARKKECTQKRQVLFPIRLVPFDAIRAWECFDADTGKDSAREIREFYIPDFSNWKSHDAYQPQFDRLLKALKSGQSEPATAR